MRLPLHIVYSPGSPFPYDVRDANGRYVTCTGTLWCARWCIRRTLRQMRKSARINAKLAT